MSRQIKTRYQDPVDVVWLHVARQCGIQVHRDAEVFASWDGHGILRIGTPETLDADDSLAQMILHELCHALVAGPTAFAHEDWGLDYDDPDHQVYEQAALRLQAALADEVGMREFFASTTDFREYFDQLPANPLNDNEDPATVIACDAMKRLDQSSWSKAIRAGLQQTRQISDIVRGIAPSSSIWHC